MNPIRILAALAIACLLGTSAAEGKDAASVLARYKAASGGSRWDAVTTIHGTGTREQGGLSGELSFVVDLARGRSSEHYKLGSVELAGGYDGTRSWQRDPGGEIAVLDAPDALRAARSQAWLDARAYWYPDRGSATYGEVGEREAHGKRYLIVEAMPEGGDAVVLWFDGDSGLLARSVQKHGADIATTSFEDYRSVDGVKIAYREVTDLTDTAGRTDPRTRSITSIAHMAFGEPVADADFAVPAMQATAHIDDASGMTRVPFDLVNNHIYVDGRIDDKPARFLVDTGGVNLLTPSAGKKFGLSGEGQLAARGVGEDSVDLSLAHARSVRVGAAVLDDPVFYVIDLGALAKVEGVECDGLVGYEMFRRFGVTIDYANRELVLTDASRFAPPPGAHGVPFTLDEHIPIVSGSLDGIVGRISVDTGSRASITLHSPFVRTHDLVDRYHAAPESVMGWGVGGASRGRPARLGILSLGDFAIDGIAGDLYTGDKGSFADPNLIGNLGGGVLRRFTVAFDYRAKTMYLAPNADFGKPDAFDRSGLFLLGDGDAFKIVDVAKESAAARAGLRDGDRIVAIDGDPVSSGDLAKWRRAFRERAAGTRVGLSIERDGRKRNVDVTLADRIAQGRP